MTLKRADRQRIAAAIREDWPLAQLLWMGEGSVTTLLFQPTPSSAPRTVTIQPTDDIDNLTAYVLSFL